MNLFPKEGNIQQNKSLSKNDYFIRKTAAKFVFASVVSMVFLYAGSFIDTLLVGSFIGEAGLAAMSLVSPVYLVYYTFGATVGLGGSIFASRQIGKDDTEGYANVFSCTSLLMLLLVIVMTVVGFVFLNPISSLLSGESGNFDMVHDYLLYYIPGGGMTLLAYIPLYFLKCEGKPKISSGLFFMSAVVNVILSWLFMSDIFDMGIGGASLATSISMALVTIIGLYILLRGNKKLRIKKESLKLDYIKTILISGTPNGLSNLFESVRIMLVNALIIGIGASALLPCYTVVRNIMDLLGAVVIGLSSALLPLIGVFYGERDHVNVRTVMRISLQKGVLIVIPLIVIVSIFPGAFASVFGVTDSSVLDACATAVPLSCFGLVFAYINTLYIGYFTAIKSEVLANILVALRLIVYVGIFALFLSDLMGISGIWLSLSLTEVFTFATYIVINIIMRKRNSDYDLYLLDKKHESDYDISFSVKNDVNDIVFASEKIGDFCDEHEIDVKKTMKISLAIEEILTMLIAKCIDSEKEQFIDIRVYKLDKEVMMRFRYFGVVFDPIKYYRDNENNEELEEELLGLKMIIKSAAMIDFKQTLGTNNLMIIF